MYALTLTKLNIQLQRGINFDSIMCRVVYMNRLLYGTLLVNVYDAGRCKFVRVCY